MKHLILFIVIYGILSCNHAEKKTAYAQNKKNNIWCTDNGCSGSYKGPEFLNGADIAHQFSNKISRKVGDKLKALYRTGDYNKVDFSKIIMTTTGMGSGNVVYHVSIPFMSVDSACDAYTSFDHVGGWNHSPELSKRKAALSSVLMAGHQLDISSLKTTPEGLQEYWIQWKNKDVQASCK